MANGQSTRGVRSSRTPRETPDSAPLRPSLFPRLRPRPPDFLQVSRIYLFFFFFFSFFKVLVIYLVVFATVVDSLISIEASLDGVLRRWIDWRIQWTSLILVRSGAMLDLFFVFIVFLFSFFYGYCVFYGARVLEWSVWWKASMTLYQI